MAHITKYTVKRRKWSTENGKKEAWEITLYIAKDSSTKPKRYRRGGFQSKGAAMAALEDFSRDVANETFGKAPVDVKPMPTLGEFVKTFNGAGSAGKCERTIEQQELATKWFMEFIGRNKPLDHITPKMIDEFKAQRLIEVQRSPATVSRELTCLTTMFNLAIRYKHLKENPCAGCSKPRCAEKTVVYLEQQDQIRLLEACSRVDEELVHNMDHDVPYLRPLIALALLTGMRKGELFHLRWGDIDFQNRRVHIVNSYNFTTKNGKERFVGLNTEAIAELTHWKQWYLAEIQRSLERSVDTKLTPTLRVKAQVRLETLRRCEPRPDRLVFPSYRTEGTEGETLPLDNIKKSLRAAVLKAGLNRRVTMHHLRHSFAVSMARANVPLTTVKNLLGHASVKTTEKYLRFYPTEGVDVADRLPSILPQTAARVPQATEDEDA